MNNSQQTVIILLLHTPAMQFYYYIHCLHYEITFSIHLINNIQVLSLLRKQLIQEY